MRRIFAIFALLCCGIAVTFAQVTVSPNPICRGYQGKVTITFDPSQGNAGMEGATACFAHTGLITSASSGDSDWKFPLQSYWRDPSTPELIQDGSVWKLEINNIYDFYGAPLYTDIRKLAFVFHDGPSGTLEGKTATDGDILVELADASGTCSYSLEMRDSNNDGWDSYGYVTISEGGDYIFGHRISYGESPKTVSVPYFGGTPTLTWHDGSYTSENTIIIFAPSGAEMFKHDQVTMSDGEVLYTMSENPCTKANPYEITGLTATSLDQVNYTFTWNKNTNVDQYLVQIYDPNNNVIFDEWKTSSDAMSYSCDLDASTASAAGDFTIVVTPYNSSYEQLSQGASETFVGNLSNIGEVTVHLLIPSDCDIDLSQGISAYWSDADDSHNGNAVLTQEGSTRWWTATMDIQAVSFNLYCATPAIDGIVRRTYGNGLYRQKDVYLEIRTLSNKYTSTWYYSIYWNIDPATPDHNYNIISVTPVGEQEKVTFTFELPQDTAYGYQIYLYRDGETSSWADTYFYKSDITANPYVRVWDITTGETVHITRVRVRQYDSYGDYIGTPYEYTTPFDILPSPLAATDITAVHNADGTYTISWNAVTGVDKFKAYFWDDNSNNYISGEEIITASTPPVGGRYSLTTSSPISPEEWCYVEIDSYTWDGSAYNYVVDASYKFLSKVKVSVLVPNDNNMDITGGLYVGYWTPLYGIADHCIALTNDGGGWWSADIYVDAPSYSFLVANSNINSTWDQWSDNIQDITSTTCCTELLYKTASKDKWPIQEGSCSASNHDYRITNVTVDVSTPGAQDISITASQYNAFAYTVEIPALSVKMSDTYYNTDIWLYYSSPVDLDGTYSIAPINYDGDTLAATYTGTFTIPANPYIPSNLQAVVQADGTTVDFTWTAPGTAPAKMVVTALNHSDEWRGWTYSSGDLAGDAVSASGTVLYSGVNEWYIEVYDASDNWLGEVQGLNFTTSSTEDYSISNINVAVSSMTATVTWTTSNPQINRCYWECYDEYDNYQNGSLISSGDGSNWEAQITLSSNGNYYWKIAPYNYNGDYYQLLSEPVKTALVAIPGGAVQYTLTLTAGAGGSVSSNPAGTIFAAGADVEITATPDAGYVFDHWSDGNTNATRTITMDGNKTFEATFAPSGATQYTLTLNAGAHGSVSASPNQATYNAGATVTITATPDAGYVFVEWNDGNTNATRTITMTGNLTYTATFDAAPPSTYTLTLNAEEGGTVSASPNQASYDPGTNVTITATPNSGYHFDHWSDGNTTASRTITMDANKTFTAYFLSDTKYTVKISAVKAEGADEVFGKIKVNDGTAKTSYNDQVYGLTVLTVTAVPDEGYTVNEWSDDDGIKSLEREIKITSDTTIKVSFREIKRYTLTVTISPAKSGTVKLNGETRDENKLTVQEGKSITVNATAAEGYKFKGWKDEDGELFETASEASVKMNRNKQITAVFEEAQGFENIKAEDVPAQKLLINGQLFILRDGKLYNAAGVLVK